MNDDAKHKEIMDVLEQQNQVLKGISTRQDNHEKLDDERFQKIPTTEDIEKVVEATMKKVLFSSSKWTYRGIIVIAVLFGSLAAIGGGLKVVLAWFGFSKM